MSIVEANISELKNKCTTILENAGLNTEDANIVVDTLLDAEMRGVHSHGLMRLKYYVQRIENGLINLDPNVKVIKENGALLLIDGDNGLGQVVANKVLDLCMAHSEKHGVTAATVRNSNHFGTCGYYTRKAASEGFYSMVQSNAGPTMAPWGGKDPMLGTNPLSISFPASDYDDFTLDIAVSATAKGKIRSYERENKKIPLGWAQDKDGFDTTDPTKAIEGTILPMGGHKGYGLAIAVDALCGGLNLGNFSYETESVTKTTKNAGTGHFFLTMKIDDLIPVNEFENHIGNWFHKMKASSKKDGVDEILIPGEIENRLMKGNEVRISVQEETLNEIEELHLA
ncbi:Ldh family oxidoreductase [Pontibacillus marinus]|uniref:Lactate dehydrogenase n=1 Tax=Pontibacillus marinus BH030004 = DSM 16465 TaxID=1385511 RepID=A0A0A5I3M0_9BACI|nr:Ldh family oxidoreductase [Pontibacillus marinus]KGX90422.1 lactate dehydrogenase [Pontibacillus marinus BH030004 = DSM 16465]